MKRLLLAALGLAAVAGTSALAADMPRGRPLPPPRAPAYVPFFTWNGFYVGINAGYGFGHSKWTDTVTQVSTGSFNVKGPLVGGTVGYNLQLGGFVFGLEGDFDWSNIKGSTTTTASAPARPPTTGSARRAAGSATPSIASCRTSPPARPSATSKARLSALASSRQPRWAGPGAPASNMPSSTIGRPRSNISMSISARRPATSRAAPIRSASRSRPASCAPA